MQDRYTGNTGKIRDSGKENWTILHETMHLLGLSDRYFEDGNQRSKDWEDDIMSKHGSTKIHDFHYQGYISVMYHNYPSKGLPNSNMPSVIRKVIDVDYRGVLLQPKPEGTKPK